MTRRGGRRLSTGGDIAPAAALAYRRRRCRLAQLSRDAATTAGRSCSSATARAADAPAADRARNRDESRRRGAHEARDHARLQCARARRASWSAARSRRRRCAAAPGETGCVISWTSFREKNVPPAGAIFGYRRPARHDRRLRQPGAARARATGCRSTAIGSRARACRCPAGRSDWSSEGPPPTPYLRTEGLVSAKCVNDGPRGYLSIRTNARPQGQAHRPHRRRGRRSSACSCRAGACTLPTCAEAQGDLIREVGEISAQSRTAARH